MGRRRSIFDGPAGATGPVAMATAPPSMPPIRWDYETPRPPPAAAHRVHPAEAYTPRTRPRGHRVWPLVSAAVGGAVLALGCTAVLIAALWLGGIGL